MPVAQPLTSPASAPPLDLDWNAALEEIIRTETYLMATVASTGRPHVVPVLGVWVNTFTFNTEVSARKAGHLATNPAIAVSAPGIDYDFVIEGTAVAITDPGDLQQVADAFPKKYEWWHPEVINGRFVADDPAVNRAVYAVQPDRIFGFGKADGFSATCWTNSSSEPG